MPAPQGGMVTYLEVHSPGAAALRIAVDPEALPQGAALSVFSDADEPVDRYPQADLRAGAAPPALYWSEPVHGDRLFLELLLPANSALPGAHPLVWVSHQVAPGTARLGARTAVPSRADPGARFYGIGTAAWCHLDLSCAPQWQPVADGVARLNYEKNGSSYQCSGSLLNTVAGPVAPYLITAHHCISSNAVAATLSTRWFWQSDGCDSGTLSPSSTQLGGGAELLATDADTDISLLRLNANPPAGTLYLGWSTEPVAEGTAVTSVHHPAGDLKKISHGEITGFWSCDNELGTDSYSCFGVSGTDPVASLFEVRFAEGTTEGGSSGGGLFRADQRLIGTLLGGNDDCDSPWGHSDYGRLERAYNRLELGRWLAQESAPVVVEPAVLGAATGADASARWTSGGDQPWRLQQSAEAPQGDSWITVGGLADNQQGWVEMEVYGPVVVGFEWRIDSEADYDVLELALNERAHSQISGQRDWEYRELALGEGRWTLRWTYRKDASASTGADRAWLDAVRLMRNDMDGDGISDEVDPYPRDAMNRPQERESAQWKVSEVYLATLNRAMNAEGLDYWAGMLAGTPGWTPLTVAHHFFGAPEVSTMYPGAQSAGEYVNALYHNLYRRPPAESGLNYWVGELESGRVARNEMIVTLLHTAWNAPEAYRNGDIARLRNRILIAQAFAAHQSRNHIVYSRLTEAEQNGLLDMARQFGDEIVTTHAARDTVVAEIPTRLGSWVKHYLSDTGRPSVAVGCEVDGGSMEWVKHFQRRPDAPELDALQVVFGGALPSTVSVDSVNGMEVQLRLYADPDGNGDPADATLIHEQLGQVAHFGTGDASSFPLPALSLPDSFFIGVYFGPDLLPGEAGPLVLALLDDSGAGADSWARCGGNGAFTNVVDALGAETTPGSFMLRATAR